MERYVEAHFAEGLVSAEYSAEVRSAVAHWPRVRSWAKVLPVEKWPVGCASAAHPAQIHVVARAGPNHPARLAKLLQRQLQETIPGIFVLVVSLMTGAAGRWPLLERADLGLYHWHRAFVLLLANLTLLPGPFCYGRISRGLPHFDPYC